MKRVDCRYCGRSVQVAPDTIGAVCSRCVMRLSSNPLTEVKALTQLGDWNLAKGRRQKANRYFREARRIESAHNMVIYVNCTRLLRIALRASEGYPEVIFTRPRGSFYAVGVCDKAAPYIHF